MNTKEKNQAIKLINTAWERIYYCISTKKSEFVISEYLRLNIQEEKKHDHYRPEGTTRGLTVNQAGKLFAVKQIVEYIWTGGQSPDVKYYIDLRQSCFMAYSLAMQFEEYLIKALDGISLESIMALDYVSLME